MSLELMGLIGLTVLIVIIFLMMSMKDTETSKKLSRYEQSIDNLAQQNHRLRKEIIELSKQRDKFIEEMDDILEDRVKEKVQHSVYPLIESMREIEHVMQSFQDEQVERIDRMEERSSEISYIPAGNTASNEKLIIAQYGSGKSEAAIAKDLRIGIGEVDLVLKLANLK
ncbi:DUF6115 domain-containing protein [Sulfurospirillum arcachonense]|uniref:DUF6115 domain-containing protein n=1 Tax=Sulfurospirillum arcachonense TaxID=57666 RepID=UPI00046A92CD|nr:hypothetical protein [Sulfurospirillum arcachonense]